MSLGSRSTIVDKCSSWFFFSSLFTKFCFPCGDFPFASISHVPSCYRTRHFLVLPSSRPVLPFPPSISFFSISSLGFWAVLSFEWPWLSPCDLHQEVDGLESFFGLDLSQLSSCWTGDFIVGLHVYNRGCTFSLIFITRRTEGPTWDLVPWWPLLGALWHNMSAMGSVPGWLACGSLLVPGASAGGLPVPPTP